MTMWTLLITSTTTFISSQFIAFVFHFSVSYEILPSEIYFILFCILLLFKLDTILFLPQTCKSLSGMDSLI